jgi:hypothetical protein
MAFLTKARGLRAAGASRPGDVVVLEFFAEGHHLVVDAVATTVYRNGILKNASSIPGYAAKQIEDRKFNADHASSQPITAIHGGPHVLLLFEVENGGRLGARALVLLRALVIVALDKGGRPPFAYRPGGRFAPHRCPCGCKNDSNAYPLGFIQPFPSMTLGSYVMAMLRALGTSRYPRCLRTRILTSYVEISVI